MIRVSISSAESSSAVLKASVYSSSGMPDSSMPIASANSSVFLVGQPDHSVQLLRVQPHFGDRISDKTVAVIGVAGQGGEVHFLFGRGQPDVGFPEDRFDVHAVFGDFIHRNLHGGERNPEFGIFVADGDVVEIEVAQIVIPIDTRRHERSGEEQQGKGSHRDKC